MTTNKIVDVDLISTFGRLIEAYTTVERKVGHSLEEQCDLPHNWYEVMLRINRSRDGLVTMGVLADQVALSSGGITRLLDRIIDAGYVERVPCPTDRRVNYAGLTPAGKAKLKAAIAVNKRDLKQIFSAFSPQDLSNLDALLDRLRT